MNSPASIKSTTWRQGLVVVLVILAAMALTYVFFSPLWHGYGLIGGDIYSYFFPQKAYFAEKLNNGEFPLWNNLVGHGYPLVAESQTGALSPINVLAYRFLDVNSAYNALQLLHYALAFLFCWMYARRMSLSVWGAGLAALVYTYGWFPARICLEWAIVGGAWLPFALWCVESYFATRHWRFLILLSFGLAMQMLPGHFNLAFITQLTLLLYVPARLWWASDGIRFERGGRLAGLVACGLAIVAAFGICAAQLAPTWELRHHSQRATINGEAFNPSYGAIPPLYWSQIVVPWLWYEPGRFLDEQFPGRGAGTNHVEAHLYFGMATLVLVLAAFLSGSLPRDRRLGLWCVLGLLAMVYTSGWLVPLTQHLPGFSFFMGPGRYGVVTTMAAAILGGAALDGLLHRLRRRAVLRYALVTIAYVALIVDFWLVSRSMFLSTEYVMYASVTETPTIDLLADSPVRELLQHAPEPVRLFCRGPNVATLLGVASTPVYLGIGPSEYFDPQTTMPEPLPFDRPPTAEQLDWLQRAGVTHILSYMPLDQPVWPVDEIWRGYDPFLNRVWARREPFFLYRLRSSRGRVAWEDGEPEKTAHVTRYRANRVEIEADSPAGGRLILTDLVYPGWVVTIDGEPAEAEIVENMYRAVDLPAGQHTIVWAYSPRPFYYGACVSLATLIALAVVAHVRFWRHRPSQSPSPESKS